MQGEARKHLRKYTSLGMHSRCHIQAIGVERGGPQVFQPSLQEQPWRHHCNAGVAAVEKRLAVAGDNEASDLWGHQSHRSGWTGSQRRPCVRERAGGLGACVFPPGACEPVQGAPRGAPFVRRVRLLTRAGHLGHRMCREEDIHHQPTRRFYLKRSCKFGTQKHLITSCMGMSVEWYTGTQVIMEA